MTNTDLIIRIGLELKGIREQIGSLNKQLAQMGKTASESQQQSARNTDQLTNSLAGAKRAVVGLLTSWASLATVIGIGRIADEAKLLDARLKLATKSAQEHAIAQQEVFAIAQRTRSEYKSTADLYARISNATKDQVIAQETILAITETINKAVQISGADPQAAAAALMQLGQGLASGTLRGEELNSVLEQTPRLADAIAKGMGITRGELRKYGEQGKITAEEVINALQKQKDVIDAEFAQLPVTMGGAIIQLRNELMKLIADFDQSTGTTSTIASAIQAVAQHLREIIKLTAILGTVIVATFITKAIPAITSYIAQLRLAIAANTAFGASLTKMQKGFALLSAALVGWEIGAYLRSESRSSSRPGSR